jgi:hypothetical protein
VTTWSEPLICRALQRQLLQSKCIVLVDNCTWAGSEADVLGVTMDGRLIDIEIKISRADFKADAKKDKWWHYVGYGRVVDGKWQQPEPIRREWPRRVWKHYYCMPADVWRDDLLAAAGSPRSGILTIAEQKAGGARYVIRCVRRAQPDKAAERLKPEQMLDIARLANLRMWDAYARLERESGDQQPLSAA